MGLPVTEEEFAVLASQGKTVIYQTTSSVDEVPDDDGWLLRGTRRDADGNVVEVFWGKIVTFDEAAAYHAGHTEFS